MSSSEPNEDYRENTRERKEHLKQDLVTLVSIIFTVISIFTASSSSDSASWLQILTWITVGLILILMILIFKYKDTDALSKAVTPIMIILTLFGISNFLQIHFNFTNKTLNTPDRSNKIDDRDSPVTAYDCSFFKPGLPATDPNNMGDWAGHGWASYPLDVDSVCGSKTDRNLKVIAWITSIVGLIAIALTWFTLLFISISRRNTIPVKINDIEQEDTEGFLDLLVQSASKQRTRIRRDRYSETQELLSPSTPSESSTTIRGTPQSARRVRFNFSPSDGRKVNITRMIDTLQGSSRFSSPPQPGDRKVNITQMIDDLQGDKQISSETISGWYVRPDGTPRPRERTQQSLESAFDAVGEEQYSPMHTIQGL